jgi:hypothetical protein
MKSPAFTLGFLAAFAAGGCAMFADGSSVPRLDYGCDDVVVVGRVATIGETSIDNPNSFLGVSTWDLRIDIKRVVHGVERRKSVPATSVSHARIIDSRDFLIVLQKAGADSYTIRLDGLQYPSARLTEHCTDALPT